MATASTARWKVPGKTPCSEATHGYQRPFLLHRERLPAHSGPGRVRPVGSEAVQTELAGRRFDDQYGIGNTNVLQYLNAVCRYSYLLSYSFIPSGFDDKNVTKANWQTLPGRTVSANEMNIAVLSDAIDSVARVWLHVWARFGRWQDETQPA